MGVVGVKICGVRRLGGVLDGEGLGDGRAVRQPGG